jgi:biotin carboxyl carrier protein
MSTSKKIVKVIINGTEYIVEVGDLSARPIIASVGNMEYQVQIDDSKGEVISRDLSGETSSGPDLSGSMQKAQSNNLVTGSRDDEVRAPMPGDVLGVLVQPGDTITAGGKLIVLEAMKMKNVIRSPRDGRVAIVHVAAGQTVDQGDVLISFE